MTSELKGSNSQTLSLEVISVLKDNLRMANARYAMRSASKNMLNKSDVYKLVFEETSAETIVEEVNPYNPENDLSTATPMVGGVAVACVLVTCLPSDVDGLLAAKPPCNAKIYKGDELVYELVAYRIEAGWSAVKVYVTIVETGLDAFLPDHHYPANT